MQLHFFLELRQDKISLIWPPVSQRTKADFKVLVPVHFCWNVCFVMTPQILVQFTHLLFNIQMFMLAQANPVSITELAWTLMMDSVVSVMTLQWARSASSVSDVDNFSEFNSIFQKFEGTSLKMGFWCGSRIL